jgi:hypothetical protein
MLEVLSDCRQPKGTFALNKWAFESDIRLFNHAFDGAHKSGLLRPNESSSLSDDHGEIDRRRRRTAVRPIHSSWPAVTTSRTFARTRSLDISIARIDHRTSGYRRDRVRAKLSDRASACCAACVRRQDFTTVEVDSCLYRDTATWHLE